jgi:hypothetical protein
VIFIQGGVVQKLPDIYLTIYDKLGNFMQISFKYNFRNILSLYKKYSCMEKCDSNFTLITFLQVNQVNIKFLLDLCFIFYSLPPKAKIVPCLIHLNVNVYTVKPSLVTTSIKQHLVLCDFNFYFPSQCVSYQLNLY